MTLATMTLTEHFYSHIRVMQILAETGCELSIRSLSAIALLLDNWRPGDPDPSDGSDSDESVPAADVIDLSAYRTKLRANV
jgi:hypothetical protein